MALQGMEQYFWFNNIVEATGDNVVLKTPEKIFAVDNVVYYWLSGIFRWMVPFDGKPSPHAIMTGQWKPVLATESKLPLGFGGVVALLTPNSCGGGANSAEGRAMRDIWKSMKTFFKLTEVQKTGDTKKYDLSGGAEEKDDCSQAEKKAFPKGAYGAMPIYLTPEFFNKAGDVQGAGNRVCYATQAPTKWILYKKDAYRLCALANGPATA